MFGKLVRSSYWMRKYTIGSFSEERRNFLSSLHGRGHSLRRPRVINKFLLGIAERVDLRQTKPITTDLALKAKTFGTCDPGGRSRKIKKKWREDPSLMEFPAETLKVTRDKLGSPPLVGQLLYKVVQIEYHTGFQRVETV